MIINISRAASLFLALTALAGAPSVAAVPLPFLATSGSALGSSIAGIDGDDFFDLVSPPAMLPLEGDARAVSAGGDVAAVLARVGAGALDTRLDLMGITGFAAADGVASFSGDVLAPAGGLALQVDLMSDMTLSAVGAFGFTELVYAVFLDGVAIVDESVLLEGVHDRSERFAHLLAPVAGSLLSLEAFLFSAAEVSPRGFAEGATAVRFAFQPAVVAPEPGVALLFACGLVLVMRMRRAR